MTSIKESSDEPNPAVANSAGEVPPPKRRTLTDYLALAIATVGVGYFPIAPGTLGALVGAGLFFTLAEFVQRGLEAYARGHLAGAPYIFSSHFAFMLVACFIVTMIGVWAATRAERLMHKKDPSAVVIDEVAGQMIALLSGPFWIQTWWGPITAFILFRAFDIWKPYPIRRLEALESGLGIMADDVLAGIYALIVNSVVMTAYMFLFAR
ncbi:MAG TPA: phosphatidylglycerophosphatase A [Pyrinomonadaceae bacterium]|nr:phosphatidylglycerophosphatase A [Pyrinomonadaceae bacterium]